MLIILNDKPCNTAEQCCLSELLTLHQVNQQGLAVAVNNSVIPKRLWPQYQLTADDNVQLFHIVTGG